MASANTSLLWHYLGSFMIYTLCVVAIFYAAFFYLKKNPRWGRTLFTGLNRFSRGQAAPAAPIPDSLVVESAVGLEMQKNLYIVRADQQRLLIAASSDGIQLLTRLEASAPIEKTETIRPTYLPYLEPVSIPGIPIESRRDQFTGSPIFQAYLRKHFAGMLPKQCLKQPMRKKTSV